MRNKAFIQCNAVLSTLAEMIFQMPLDEYLKDCQNVLDIYTHGEETDPIKQTEFQDARAALEQMRDTAKLFMQVAKIREAVHETQPGNLVALNALNAVKYLRGIGL